MHGARSQDDHHLAVNAGFVHDLTREAIIGGLAAHHFLTAQIGDGRVESMARLYERLTTPHKALFEVLRQELRKTSSLNPPQCGVISRP